MVVSQSALTFEIQYEEENEWRTRFDLNNKNIADLRALDVTEREVKFMLRLLRIRIDIGRIQLKRMREIIIIIIIITRETGTVVKSGVTLTNIRKN